MGSLGTSRHGSFDSLPPRFVPGLALAIWGLFAGLLGFTASSGRAAERPEEVAAQRAVAENAANPAKAAKPAEKDAGKDAGKNAGKDAGKDAGTNAGKDAGKNASRKPASQTVESSYMRVRRGDNKTAQALETSILRFVREEPGKPPVEVDLVGVVHIGERQYYDELNKLFKGYEAVLYELVAPEGTRVPKGGGKAGAHPISAMQKGLQSMLALEYQLEHIDYHASNFIHADMTPDEMSKSMKDRQESWSQMFFRMMGQGMAQQSRQPGGDINLFSALFAKDRSVKLKRVFAQQFDNMEGMSAFDGPEGSTLITERNKKALRVLDRELMAGKRRLAIFYGAGHMKDMEERLVNEFKMRRVSATWLTAWRMDGASPAQPDAAKPDAAKPDNAKPDNAKPASESSKTPEASK